MTALTGLSPDYTALQKEVQAVSEKLDPIAVEADQSSGLHQQVLAILRESGLMRLWFQRHMADGTRPLIR